MWSGCEQWEKWISLILKKKKVKQGHSWKTRSILRNLGYNTENSCGENINIVSKGTITREQ